MKKIFLSLLTGLTVARGQTTTTTVPVRDKTYYPEAYGAKVNDGVDDKTALQACIDAAEAAGGGIVQLAAGTYTVKPLLTGIGLLVNGDKICLRGVGHKTIIHGITVGTGSATDTNHNFGLIGAEGYNTTSTAYGASGLWIEDLKLECDSNVASATSTAEPRNGAGLLELVHVPWAIVRGVTFGDVVWHQIEVQRAKNCLIEDCDLIGNTEAPRIQFDEGGGAGQGMTTQYRASLPPSSPIENITFRRCRLAGRNTAGQNVSVVRNWELDHTGNVLTRNILIEDCEIGPVYNTSTAVAGYGIAFDGSSTARCDGLTIRRCRFIGDATGYTYGLYLVPGTSAILRNVLIDSNFVGAGIDAAGVKFDGGFQSCLTIGTNTSGATITGNGGGTITGYGSRQNITVRNNRFAPRYSTGLGGATLAPNQNFVIIGSLSDATIEGNQLKTGIYSDTATNSTTTWTSSAAHDMDIGDRVQLTTSGTLPTGFSLATTYYVVDRTETTFKLSASAGGSAISGSGGSGTHRWTKYMGSITLGYSVGFAVSEVQNLRMVGNNAFWAHTNAASNYTSSIYSMIFTTQGLEAGSVTHGAMIGNNINVAPGGSGGTVGLGEYGSGTTYGVGSISNNITSGTWSSNPVIHGGWLPYGSANGADIASAGTVNLSTATGDTVNVTGTTTITALTIPTGQQRTVRFTDALTLTYNASTLILPGNASISTAAGDVAIFRGYSGSVVRCINYQRQATAP